MHQPFVPSWTRDYTYEDDQDCNRLVTTINDSSSRDHTHDEHGHVASTPHLEMMDGDYADELRHVDKGSGTGQKTWFVYDAIGERVRKVYVDGAAVIISFEEYHPYGTSSYHSYHSWPRARSEREEVQVHGKGAGRRDRSPPGRHPGFART